MIPMSFTVINTQLPPSRRPLGLFLFGITATMAPAIGPYIGGLLTDSYGWPMVFYINFIPGAVMLATIFFAIDPEPLNMALLWKGDWLGMVFSGHRTRLAHCVSGGRALEQVQQYSAKQTGEAMVLIGLPQLLVFPIVPRLMKAFDLRLIVFAGALVFGGACLLNTHMNPDFGGPQFQIGNIVRALGQPFTIVPLSALATAGLLREQQGDGSALFNIMRNLGGSVGTALLSTMITQREQFHDFRIGERVTPYDPYVQQFLSNQAIQNLQHSGDPAGALQQAYRMLQASVQTNSYVMAYSECFLVLGIILLIGSASIWLCKKTKATGAAVGH